MATQIAKQTWTMAIVLSGFLLVGCDDVESSAPTRKIAAPSEAKAVEGKKVVVGDNVDLEVIGKTRRVLVYAEVCMREGPLEQLLTRKERKEHEAILAAKVDARKIHEALLLAGAKEGSTVRWQPKYQAPSGTPIKISLRYTDKKGKEITVSARSWIRDIATKGELSSDWVFAGSILAENPFDKTAPKTYLANEGDVICVANFESALLDVPFQSSKADATRGYECWTDRIPATGTKVLVILEPQLKVEKK